MTSSKIEQKIAEIEQRSPIKLEGFWSSAKFDLQCLCAHELDEVEAVVGHRNGGRMGSSLYCVNRRGELVYKCWPLSSPLRKIELNPLKDNLIQPVMGAGFFGGITVLGTRGDLEYTLLMAGLGAASGALASIAGYFKDREIKRTYERYVQQRE
ncbi:MAG: hypothetical protein AB1668_05790 [Nanoarchaeota archaeon]